jgi:hypothetical protein
MTPNRRVTHRTTKILSHARRSGSVAARGARAAAGDSGDRLPAQILQRAPRALPSAIACFGNHQDIERWNHFRSCLVQSRFA